MAAKFNKTVTNYGPKLTPDNIYWRKYPAPVLVKEFGPIDYIDFSPIEPHHFAVTCSVRVQIYNPITKLVTKNLNRFKEAAYGGSFRADGKLLCSGGAESVVKLFDVQTKNLLRLFSGHKGPVHRSFFTCDGAQIVSFSDDKTTAIWDIPTEKQLLSFDEHTDYVRAGATSPRSPDILISGGYDKIINMYDARTNKKVFSVNHGAPVESVLFLPSGSIFLSAGGTEIKVWDALSHGKLLAKINQHHKTVTCLKIASNGSRILSGSLDRHVKIYDTGTYKTVHTLDYPNSVLSLGISADDDTIAVGMVDGLISIRRKEEEINNVKSTKKKVSHQNTSNKLNIDKYVKDEKKEVMSKHDECFRKFQSSKALDCVMVSYVANKTPHVTVGVFRELIQRRALHQALAGRDGKSLVNIIKFIIKNFGDIRFERVLLSVTDAIVDIYGDNIEKLSKEVQTSFKLLEKRMKEEEELLNSFAEISGMIKTILASKEECHYEQLNVQDLKLSTPDQ